MREKERLQPQQPPQPQIDTDGSLEGAAVAIATTAVASGTSSSTKIQLALLTTAMACQEKDEMIAKLEAEYERYLMKKTESEELANALRLVHLPRS